MTEKTKLSFSFGLNIPMSPLKSDKASKLTRSSAALVQRKNLPEQLFVELLEN